MSPFFRSRASRISVPMSVLCVLFLNTSVVHAQEGGKVSAEVKAAQFASGKGNIAFLVLGIFLPLLTDGRNKTDHSLRTLDALGTSGLASLALKYITHEKRPDSDERTSFPSGHATAAFAVAAMQSRFHPRQGGLWYLGAALIAQSRVRLGRHRQRDVVAGAILGTGTATLEPQARRGLLIAPFIRSDSNNHLQLGMGGRF